MFDHVDFKEAGWRIATVGKCANRDAASNGCTHAFAAFALPVDVQTRIGQQAIDGRRADLKELGFDDRIKVKVAMSFHGINQHWNQRL